MEKSILGDFAQLLGVNSAQGALRAVENLSAFMDNPPRLGASPEFVQSLETAREQRVLMQQQVALLTKQVEIAEAARITAELDAVEAKAETRRAYRLAILGLVVGVAGLLLAAWPYLLAL